MIIDVHGHLIPPTQLLLYREFLIGTRGHYGQNCDAGISNPRSGWMPDEVHKEFADEHVGFLDGVGTDMQLISMRPYTLMHSEKPPKIVRWWAESVNNAIAGQVKHYPTRLQGIANLPQVWGEPISGVFDELDRCVNDLGFVGVLINPDPSEGRETPDVPGLGDEYWYPLYEKLVEYELPMLVHSCGCVTQRESQSLHFINEESIATLGLLEARVFDTFPELKVIVHHGGGAIPYQVGRFRGVYWTGRNLDISFDDALKQIYFDTTLYTAEAMALLFQVMGADNLLLGTERPGDGAKLKTSSGRDADDLRAVIEELPGYSDEERAKVLGGNALKLFPRLRRNLDALGVLDEDSQLATAGESRT